MIAKLPIGHDAETAFHWWDGSRTTITQEPLDVAVALHAMTPGISRAAAIAAAHVVPLTTGKDDIRRIAGRIDAWLGLERNSTGIETQFALKNAIQAIIATDGIARCEDLADVMDDHSLNLTANGYAIDLSLDRFDVGIVLSITAGRIGRNDRTTIAEIVLGDDRGDPDGIPNPETPEPAVA